MIPEVALLEIFQFYVDEAWLGTWHRLVHVCRKWRSIVFGSPLRLDLQLKCEAGTPVREMLDVWPRLPIVVWSIGHERWGVDNIIAALEHKDRICQLDLDIPSSHLEKVLQVLQQPVPALTRLVLRLDPLHETAPIVPASFLGGSAPRLKILIMNSIPFPGLPKLLSSATHLVRLELWRIPDSGYISPEGIVTCLSVLTRLEYLDIDFNSPRCHPDRKSRRPPPRTRIVLPCLTILGFGGAGEYLEDLVARVDAPLLDKLEITFSHQLILDTPQLTQFISRTPNFKTCDDAYVVFTDSLIWVKLPQTSGRTIELGVFCSQSDWQLSSLAQVCNSSFPLALVSMVERLHILSNTSLPPLWQDDIENSQWLELFHPFAAVKDLYISSEFTPRIAPFLQEFVGERVTEVLPTLQTLFLEGQLSLAPGPVQEAIGLFVAARQLAGHPIAVSRWERETDKFV
jgi:hypothetical protein